MTQKDNGDVGQITDLEIVPGLRLHAHVYNFEGVATGF